MKQLLTRVKFLGELFSRRGIAEAGQLRLVVDAVRDVDKGTFHIIRRNLIAGYERGQIRRSDELVIGRLVDGGPGESRLAGSALCHFRARPGNG